MSEETVAPMAEEVPATLTFDMSMKKKKKKTGSATASITAEEEATAVAGEGAEKMNALEAASETFYDYEFLLKRIYENLRENNPELSGDKRKLTLVPPQVIREGSKKTAFANITDLARRLNRTTEHLTSFLLAELGTTGSVDGTQRLIIKGRFQQLQIETVLRKYILEYVTCRTCRSPETRLSKENRLFFMTCEACGSQRSVAAIKTGFKAQIGRRIKEDN